MKVKPAKYRIIEGSAPFLVSAPHVYSHKRPTLVGRYKQGEPITDLICQQICRDTEATGILITEEVEYDPNFFKIKRNPYKDETRKIVKDEKKEIFLDIHGLNDEHHYDIGLYYLSRFSKSKRVARELRRALDKGELRGISIQIFRLPENDQETLSKFIASKLRIPALQIEVARYIREDELLRNSLIQNISNFLNSY